MTDPRLRFRVWIAGRLADERWVDTSQPGATARVDLIQARHADLTSAADATGQPWLVEVYDPAQPLEQAHVRFGTDEAGMVDPKPWMGPFAGGPVITDGRVVQPSRTDGWCSHDDIAGMVDPR